jgi:putative NAD(P)-binding protein
MSSTHRNGTAAKQVTVVGAGIAGLVAAIACAEEGANVRLVEAHEKIGGRARSTDGPYKANLGPHALYKDGHFWDWMKKRDLLPANVTPRLTGARLRLGGVIRRTPPLGALPSVLRLRGREAPVDIDFRTWASTHTDEATVEMLSAAAGVYTFHHDPGSLSAAFVWPRTVRLFLTAPSSVRYPVGGWNALVATLEQRVRALENVYVETSTRVDSLPATPVILATEIDQARELLGDDSLRWQSGNTLCLDLGLRRRKGDPALVSDMDEAGWIGRYSTTNPSIAPHGEELVQAQMPIRPSESADRAGLRLERLLDLGLIDWRERETWRRRQVMDARSGALDPPGASWRDRPAVDRGDGVFVAGDMMAAPGLLAEVSWASAVEAGRLALEALNTLRPRLRKVA